jgi:hypothetical protein
MSYKHKSASPSAIQVKNQQKTISTEEKLDIISRNVRLAGSSVRGGADKSLARLGRKQATATKLGIY